MRLVYAADLHGDIDSYRSLLDLAVTTDARAAIVGGDLLPHAITLQSALQTQRDFIAEQLAPLLELFRAQHPEIDVYLLPGNDDWAAAIMELDRLEQAGLVFLLHERVYALTPQPALPDPHPHGRPPLLSPVFVVVDGFLVGLLCVVGSLIFI